MTIGIMTIGKFAKMLKSAFKENSSLNISLSRFTSSSHLDAEARPGGEGLLSQLLGEVSGSAPGQAIVDALHHHGAGRAAEVEVEADAVDKDHQAFFLVHHDGAQVQAVGLRSVVHNK